VTPSALDNVARLGQIPAASPVAQRPALSIQSGDFPCFFGLARRFNGHWA
jgi:hypothetical protein